MHLKTHTWAQIDLDQTHIGIVRSNVWWNLPWIVDRSTGTSNQYATEDLSPYKK